MRTKILILVVALIVGGVAAVLAARYLGQARTTIEAESEPIEVYVAKEDIPRGLSAEELISKKLIVLEPVPRRFAAAGSVSSAKALEGRVLAAPLTAGEQVTTARFELPTTAGLAYSIPADFLAVSIPVDEVKGISGLVKPGDHLMIFLTVSPGPGGEKEFTHVLLEDVKILAVGGRLQSPESSGGGDGGVLAVSRDGGDESSAQATDVRSVTVAVSPADAERLILAEESGKVWSALRPASAEELPETKGQTAKTVFK